MRVWDSKRWYRAEAKMQNIEPTLLEVQDLAGQPRRGDVGLLFRNRLFYDFPGRQNSGHDPPPQRSVSSSQHPVGEYSHLAKMPAENSATADILWKS